MITYIKNFFIGTMYFLLVSALVLAIVGGVYIKVDMKRTALEHLTGNQISWWDAFWITSK